MSILTFKALIDGVHYDPKKGALKIQLIAASHVSMDKLTSLGPSDESIEVTLQSPQTKIIGNFSPEAEAALGEGEKWLKEASDKLAEHKEAEEVEEETGDGII